MMLAILCAMMMFTDLLLKQESRLLSLISLSMGDQHSAVIDSCFSSNIIDKGTWKNMKRKRIKCKAQANRTSKQLFAGGSNTPLRIWRTFKADISLSDCPGNKTYKTQFVVIDGKGISLLGKKTEEKLCLFRIGFPLIESVVKC